MKPVMMTTGDRIRKLDKQGINELSIMQRRLAKLGKSDKQILEATDKFLKKHGIGEYKLC